MIKKNKTNHMNTRSIVLYILVSSLFTFSMAAQFPISPSGSEIVGEVRIAYPQKNDTLLEIGERYEMGFDELKWANPNVNSWTPGETTPIIIPSQYILPKPHEGIVLNIPEMRAYYFPKKGDKVYVYPVSVGRMDWKTPLGRSTVTVKQKDPNWYPPTSIQKEHLENGRGVLPKVVPGGPDNPLGRHVLRLSIPSYLLHGTNDPTGIGMRVTHGCMRFFPKNIEELFTIVPVGTPVYMINEIVKIGWHGDKLMMEVHASLEEDNLTRTNIIQQALAVLKPYQGDPNIQLVSMNAFEASVDQMSGIPVEIGRRRSNEPQQDNTPAEPIDEFNIKAPIELISHDEFK